MGPGGCDKTEEMIREWQDKTADLHKELEKDKEEQENRPNS